ncbi:MAG: alpha/beta hydrolase [Spirulina sp. SIO3F2]|nr:alpha/beta hydrolase [Spirulina sp. SIO3F2]
MKSKKNSLMVGVSLSSLMGLGLGQSALAANFIQFGTQTYPVEQLSSFAETGEETPIITTFITIKKPDSSLKEMQDSLNRKIDVDVERIDELTVEDLHPNDYDWLTGTFPGITDQELQDATRAIHSRGQDVTVINFIKSFPLETITSQSALDDLLANPIVVDQPAPGQSNSLTNILYLNSIRGKGTGGFGGYRYTIADALNNYEDGNVFNVDFIPIHSGGNLSDLLNDNPIEHYNQIWFDTTISGAKILNQEDFLALNRWSSYSQPEFILDTSFFHRNLRVHSLKDAASAVTINEALALRDAGGGIFIGTDGEPFAQTANQILENFGFDGLFKQNSWITADGEFIGDLALLPEIVGSEFFYDNLRGLSTTNIPIGVHTLNENAGNRTIELREHLYAINTRGDRMSLIAASFEFGSRRSDITDPQPVPEPSTLISLIVFGTVGLLTCKR